MTNHTPTYLRFRACKRIAYVIREATLDGVGIHSRIFDYLVHDSLIISGESVQAKNGEGGKRHKEHIVPCAVIRDEAVKMFANGRQLDEVAEAINQNLHIVYVSTDEKNIMDKKLGLRYRMPDGWIWGESSPFDRIKEANIILQDRDFYKSY